MNADEAAERKRLRKREAMRNRCLLCKKEYRQDDAVVPVSTMNVGRRGVFASDPFYTHLHCLLERMKS